MISDNLCPAVYILLALGCTFSILMQDRLPEGDDVLKNRGGNFCPSVGGRGSLREDGA